MGLTLVLIGTFIAGIGWIWDKIKGKQQSNHPNTTMRVSSIGNQSLQINMQQNNYYPEPKKPKSTASENNPQNQPIQHFAGKYTLSADLNIQNSNVHINGISR